MNITIYKINVNKSVYEIAGILNNKKINEDFLKARESKFSNSEVFIQYYFTESIENCLKRVIDEDNLDEIVSIFRNNGKTKVLKKVYCFINVSTQTLEIYRGLDKKTEEIAHNIAKLLNSDLENLKISQEKLLEIINKHSLELRQAAFGNLNGFVLQTFSGRHLEKNNHFKEHLEKFWKCLLAITIKPKIRFLNGNGKYSVTFNGNKGTIKISNGSEIFKFKPRFEIRQIINFLFF